MSNRLHWQLDLMVTVGMVRSLYCIRVYLTNIHNPTPSEMYRLLVPIKLTRAVQSKTNSVNGAHSSIWRTCMSRCGVEQLPVTTRDNLYSHFRFQLVDTARREVVSGSTFAHAIGTFSSGSTSMHLSSMDDLCHVCFQTADFTY